MKVKSVGCLAIRIQGLTGVGVEGHVFQRFGA